MLTQDQVIETLALAASYDDCEALFWHSDIAENPRLLVFCSDTFDYATADCEPVETTEDVAALRKAYLDAVEAEANVYPSWGSTLYCARRRRTRPLPWVNGADSAIRALLDAAGPEAPSAWPAIAAHLRSTSRDSVGGSDVAP